MKIINATAKLLSIAFAFTAFSALAQSGSPAPNVTGSGTANSVAKFSDTSTIANSNLYEVNGQVGIGTPTPTSNLSIANSSGDGVSAPQQGIIFLDSTLGTSGAWPQAGLYGIGYSGFNGGLVLATDGINGYGVTEKMRILPAGNVGIGTSTPASTLEVNGSIAMTAGSGGAIIFPDGTRQFTASSGSGSGGASVPSGISEVNGNVGIGTPAPVSSLTIANPSNDGQAGPQNGIVFIDSLFGISNTWPQAAMYSMGYPSASGGLIFATAGAWGAGLSEKMRIDPTGKIGIGTTTPTATLEINGNFKLTAGSGASVTFPDGTVQSTAYTGTCVATGGDYAESVDVIGEKAGYEPGDVMVLDTSHPGTFLKSSEPYSTLVAGIYSTKPGYVGRRQQTSPKLAAGEVPMAMVGIVPTKVSTENGAIRTGDLLVTSSRAGYVMKGTDRNRMVGAVVGKAMGNIATGEGEIEVLVSLQ